MSLLYGVQFFTDDPANNLFEGLFLTFHIGSEGIIEHRLEITATFVVTE
ncbi:MAG: hypothetical protein R6W95_02485 [Desulfosarcina sp.]